MGIDAEMFVKYVGSKPTEHQLKLWSWDLCRAVGAENFFIRPEHNEPALSLCGARYSDKPEEVGKVWHQDGEPIYAAEGEWFVDVHFWTCYYGEGYERGNWQVICATAEWLEQNIGGAVFYGGDSSGVCAELFDAEARAKMRRHALSKDGRNYFNGFEREPFKTPPPCSLCVKERGMTRHGWGNNYIAVSCGGCGRSFQTCDDGVTWSEEKKEN